MGKWKKHKSIWLWGGLAVFLAVLAGAVQFGNYEMKTGDILGVISAHLRGNTWPDASLDTIVWEIRLPRILTAAMTGVALSISGAVFQGVFRNPLVEPYVLGVSSGAAFGAAASIVFSWGFLTKKYSRIFIRRSGYGFWLTEWHTAGENMPVVRLILSGMIVSAVFTALLNFLKVMASDSKLREITFWTMGGFYTAEWEGAVRLFLLTLGGLVLIWGCGWKLNVLAMGDAEARSLGIHTGRLKFVLILAATFLTASCVAESGIISWVGLMVPHAARMILGPDHRYMIPFPPVWEESSW